MNLVFLIAKPCSASLLVPWLVPATTLSGLGDEDLMDDGVARTGFGYTLEPGLNSGFLDSPILSCLEL
jgi:hypothetical protein